MTLYTKPALPPGETWDVTCWRCDAVAEQYVMQDGEELGLYCPVHSRVVIGELREVGSKTIPQAEEELRALCRDVLTEILPEQHVNDEVAAGLTIAVRRRRRALLELLARCPSF